MSEGLLLILDLLAVHRLTRLWTKDTISQPYRERIIAWAYRDRLDGETPDTPPWPKMWQHFAEDDGEAPRLAVLMVCRWCVAVHLAAAVTLLRWSIPTVWTPCAYALALASLGVLLARIEADD